MRPRLRSTPEREPRRPVDDRRSQPRGTSPVEAPPTTPVASDGASLNARPSRLLAEADGGGGQRPRSADPRRSRAPEDRRKRWRRCRTVRQPQRPPETASKAAPLAPTEFIEVWRPGRREDHARKPRHDRGPRQRRPQRQRHGRRPRRRPMVTAAVGADGVHAACGGGGRGLDRDRAPGRSAAIATRPARRRAHRPPGASAAPDRVPTSRARGSARAARMHDRGAAWRRDGAAAWRPSGSRSRRCARNTSRAGARAGTAATTSPIRIRRSPSSPR